MFQRIWEIPAIRELLNDLDKGTEILEMIDLMTFIEKPSKPIDLVFDKFLTIFSISTSAQGNKYIDDLLLYVYMAYNQQQDHLVSY